MALEDRIQELKNRLSDLKDRRLSIKSEIDVKTKYLEQTKKDLQEKLDKHNISYKNLDKAIEQLTASLTSEMEIINKKLEDLLAK